MPTQQDFPIGVHGSFDQWGLWGSAGSKLAAVASADGDTSVIYAASGGAGYYQAFYFPFLGGVGDPVNSASITASVREYAHGAGHIFFVLFGNVTGTFGVDTDFAPTVHAAGGAYASCTDPAAGAQLALAVVNGYHSLGFSGAGGPSNKAEFWCTYFYRTVDYGYGASAGAGPFTHLIGSIVGAMIGSGLSLREMPAVSAMMKRKARKWLRPDEYETAWRAWREHKFAVWSI